MRSSVTWAAAVVAVLPSLATAIATPEGKTVGFKFEKRLLGRVHPDEPHRLLSRQTVNTPISNFELLYLINVTVGSNSQELSLQLDTGSSDIWFPSEDSQICTSSRYRPYCDGASYSPSTSDTYRQLDLPAFDIQYVDGTEITGDYFTDTLRLGDTEITNLTMAAASQFDRFLGIMGIGFQSGESSNSGRNPFTYPNIINLLKDQGKIDSLSYSLWLDDLQANTGSILFGGVDKDKYIGSLEALPIQKDTQSGDYTSFTVAWTGLRITGSGNDLDLSPSSPQPAILDSGTTLTYLPDSIAQSIYDGLGVVSYQGGQLNTVPCEIAQDDLVLTYTFGGDNGIPINVTLAELVVPLQNQDGSTPRINGKDICQFGIAAAGTDPILFGDTFLRSAYVVYDLDNLEIGLAQTNFNAQPGDGNVEPIQSGIPDITRTADAASVENTYTGRPLRTAAITQTDLTGATASRSASFKLTPTSTSSSGGNDKNAAPKPTPNHSALAALVVTGAAFFFGAMLI